jgi:glycosyltransferase involved in cell wall biosynthesis
MAKILIIPDSRGWAIDQLVQKKIKYNQHHNFACFYVHPRDAAQPELQQQLLTFIDEFKPDIIHFEYYRSAQQLLESLPQLQKYKIILTHHNQRKNKALLFRDWNAIGVDILVTHTEKAAEILRIEGKQRDVRVIKHGIDLDYFSFDSAEPAKFVVGYAGRIVPWKRLDLVAKVCKELDMELMFMGKMDKMDYWTSIPEDVRNNINFSFMDCSNDDRINFYRSITVFANVSDDEYEEGPLGFFEAAATGVPIVTTPNGTAADIVEDKENALMIPFGNEEFLKRALMELRDNKELRDRLRENMWQTIKNFSDRRMAFRYSKLYYEMYGDSKPLVSVVLPTLNRIDQIAEILGALTKQTYKNFELIVADDGSTEPLHDLLKQFAKDHKSIPIKYVLTDSKLLRENGHYAYGLGKARNMAVCEAEGEFILFLDSRLKPLPDCIEKFEGFMRLKGKGKLWIYGQKGGVDKRTFVENFSFVRRVDFVKFGMMNERINRYGGLSQELRDRWLSQGGSFEYVETAKADEMKRARKSTERRSDIIKMKDLLFKLLS